MGNNCTVIKVKEQLKIYYSYNLEVNIFKNKKPHCLRKRVRFYLKI